MKPATTANTAERLRFPLRLTVPLALLVFVAAATWSGLRAGRHKVVESVQRHALRDVAWILTSLEADAERAYRVQDAEAVQHKMAAFAGDRKFMFAVACDEDYRVLHSMHVGDIGKPFEEALPAAYGEIPLLTRDSLNAIRKALGGKVETVGDDHTVVAAYPLVLGTGSGELLPNRVGNLVVIHDSSALVAEALSVVTDEALRFFFLLAMFAVGLGLFFHFGVARRLGRVANVARQVGAGNMEVRSGLGGSDEVAELSWAVDQMVSEKAAAEKALKESEERHRSLFESTHDLVQSVATDGRFLFVNPAWRKTLGYSADEVKNLTLFDVIHRRDHEHCRQLLQRILAGDSVRGIETTFVTKDGDEVIVEGNATGRFVDGKLVATHGFFRDITERKQAQAQTAERQNRLEAILNTAADSIITIDEQGIIQSANPASERLFGYQVSELIGNNVGRLMPNSFAERHDGYVANYVKTGQRKIIGIGREVEAKRKDGTTFPVDLAVSELDAGGQRLFTGIVRDISERRLAEAEQQSLGRILENSLNEIYVFDANSLLFMQVNQGARDNTGYSLEELRKLTPLDLNPFTPNKLSQLIETLRAGEKEQVVFETAHRRKDGSLYDVEVHLQLDTFRGAQALVAIILDTTERKRAEQSLRVQQRALESAVNGIIITDPNQPDNPIVYVNPAALQITGYTEGEVMGQNCRFLQREERDQEALHEVRAAIKEQRKCRVVLRNFRKDGTPFWNELTISPVRDEDGKLTHFVGILSDITARRDAEEALARVNQELDGRVRKRTRQLEEAQQQLVQKEKLATLGQLAGSVAHEIRNPLGVIRNAAYYLEQTHADCDDEDTKEALGEISRGIANAERIVSELLDYAREPKAETSPFSLSEAIDAALRIVQLPASVRVARADAAGLRATGDREQIERLLANLIQNAAQAMPKGGTLTLRCAATNGRVVTEVSDTGIGISAQDLEKIFDPLFTKKAKGIGLGLALCRRYAELNKGALDVESEPGQGSTFRLSLPGAETERD